MRENPCAAIRDVLRKHSIEWTENVRGNSHVQFVVILNGETRKFVASPGTRHRRSVNNGIAPVKRFLRSHGMDVKA